MLLLVNEVRLEVKIEYQKKWHPRRDLKREFLIRLEKDLIIEMQ